MATRRITVTAVKPVHYDGRSHVRGAVFTATPVDAASLKYRGLVKLGGQLAGGSVPEHPSITRRMEPVAGFRQTPTPEPPVTPVTPDPPMPTNEEPIEQPAGESIEGDHQDEPARTPRGRRGGRGTYQRRDMNAEPPAAE